MFGVSSFTSFSESEFGSIIISEFLKLGFALEVTGTSVSFHAPAFQCTLRSVVKLLPKILFCNKSFWDFFELFLKNFQLTFDTFSFEIDGTSDFNRKKPVLIDCIRRLSFEFAISRRVFLSSAFLSPSLLPFCTRDDRLLNSCMSCIVAIPPTKPAFICFSRKSSLLSLVISDKIQL